MWRTLCKATCATPSPTRIRLQQLDARVSQWMQLARRYKRTPPELPALLQDWKDTLHRLDSATGLAALQAAEQAHGAAYQKAARALSQGARQGCAAAGRPSPAPCRAWAWRAGASRCNWTRPSLGRTASAKVASWSAATRA